MKYSILYLIILSCANTSVFAQQEPTVEWIQQFGTTYAEESVSVYHDGVGGIYVSGDTSGILAGGSEFVSDDAFLRKYDGAGNAQWTQQLGASETKEESRDVWADGLGNVYFGGVTDGVVGSRSAGSLDGYVAKYDDNGSPLWVQQFGTSDWDMVNGLSGDDLGNLYVVGRTKGGLFSPSAVRFDGFLSKYDDAGNLLWGRQFGGVAEGRTPDDSAAGVAVDNLGNVYVTGWTRGKLGQGQFGFNDAFLSKYDQDGNLLWTQQLGDSNAATVGGAVSTDVWGNVYITGSTQGSLGGPNQGDWDGFASKYDNSGLLIWTRQFGTSEYDLGHDIWADGQGNAFIVGRTEGALSGVSEGGSDMFVSKLNDVGIVQWTWQQKTTSSEWRFNLSGDNLGNIYISGQTDGSLGGPNAGSWDAFIMKLTDPTHIPEPSAAALAVCGLLSFFTGRRAIGRRKRA